MAGEPKDPDARRSSDFPVDLVKERETFVRGFLRKGVELTEELLRENEALRARHEQLARDNARLRAQVASDDAIRDLLKTVEALEREKRDLLDHTGRLEQSKRTDASRYEEIETELNDLANLYVASFQLHASLSPRRVVRHLRDMLGQLVGAHGFAIYLHDVEQGLLVSVAHEGLEGSPPATRVGEGPIGEACLTGIALVAKDLGDSTLERPLAVIPMLVEGKPVGAVAIATVLEQKGRWESLDHELFKLIGAHAGPALIASNLYASESSPAQALSGFSETLVKRSTSMTPPDGE